jgi:hypothetical protein
VKALAGSLVPLEAERKKDVNQFRRPAMSRISTLTQHVPGSSKDTSDNQDQRIKSWVTLGKLVDGGSGLSSVGSLLETGSLSL